jgi:hypothetical protein
MMDTRFKVSMATVKDRSTEVRGRGITASSLTSSGATPSNSLEYGLIVLLKVTLH